MKIGKIQKSLNRSRCSSKNSLILDRTDALYALVDPCCLCPHLCGARRLHGQKGACQAGPQPKVAAALPHLGEEPPLCGQRGSGTVFFSNCSLRCLHCQNYEISLLGQGRALTIDQLAELYLSIQSKGCHNLNLVSATHYLPFVIDALHRARLKGFQLPVVYNSSGYERTAVLTLLEGVIDIYLPDAKYGHSQQGKNLSSVSNYSEVNRQTIREMYRQVGSLVVDTQHLATKGLIVRHLVLPNGLAGSRQVLRMMMEETAGQTPISLMGQYFPTPLAKENPLINRRITNEEWCQVLKWVDIFDIPQGWIQRPERANKSHYIPDFSSEYVFPFMIGKGSQQCLKD
ncbi:radical SAM protein [candidate division CSSED10-310 bacterium]|uniref:Radical SAM protein n=1 Tax=candidate division CSSED10-310 bacterium TaxID=2855610 RepID=A0ABV6YYX9_UNCC1